MKLMSLVAPRAMVMVGYILWRSSASSALASSVRRHSRTVRAWTSVGTVRGGSIDSNARHVSSNTALNAASKMDQSFPTWSFDKPCASMEWSTISNVTIALATDQDSLNNADLVVLGMAVPPKASEDDDKDDTDDTDATAPPLTGMALTMDQALKGALAELLVETKKTFKYGAKAGAFTPTLRPIGGDTAPRVTLWGLGVADAPSGRSLGKALAERLASDKSPLRTVHIAVPGGTLLANATAVREWSTAFYQDLVSDNRYRTGDKIKTVAPDLVSIVLFVDDKDVNRDEIAAEIARGRQLATGVLLAKDIVNAPHNVLNSESLADTAKRIAKEHSSVLKCQVLGKKECEARGMGAYLGVARGSETEPQFIHLTYTPKSSATTGTPLRKIGVVGKGLLFDTGGYNIKTAMMEQMKFDCGGAAAVLGAARAIGALQPPNVEVHFVVAACENMINQKAMVPSDILTASNGKTIEVLNTDAEGRLTLADALVFVDTEVQCESIIELSTLTGACMVALGKQVSGVWTSNDALATELAAVSHATGDQSWRMPLVPEYADDLESKIADLKNIGGKYGGSITAALFLQNFVSKKKPFAHIDMAGPVWSDKTGATGYGTKLIVEWVTRQGQVTNENAK